MRPSPPKVHRGHTIKRRSAAQGCAHAQDTRRKRSATRRQHAERIMQVGSRFSVAVERVEKHGCNAAGAPAAPAEAAAAAAEAAGGSSLRPTSMTGMRDRPHGTLSNLDESCHFGLTLACMLMCCASEKTIGNRVLAALGAKFFSACGALNKEGALRAASS